MRIAEEHHIGRSSGCAPTVINIGETYQPAAVRRRPHNLLRTPQVTGESWKSADKAIAVGSIARAPNHHRHQRKCSRLNPRLAPESDWTLYVTPCCARQAKTEKNSC